MKYKSKPAFLLFLAIMLIFPQAAMAATYKDVPSNHYAYRAVDWVSNPSNGSFMVGDATNNFNPNRTLDKFETAKILAVAAGYKYAASAISPAEQELYDRSYNEWKSLLDSQASQYAKWSRTADREIAYLLYKNILTVTDVGTFITRAGTEQVNLITRQEAIVFMIRLDGKQMEADAIVLPYHTPYKDDGQIRSDYKKYIYYAKEAGIAGGSDGYISPSRNFTRAEMAQMFYNMFANRPQATPTPQPNNNVTSTVSGAVDYVFTPQGQGGSTYVYINSYTSGQVGAYPLSPNAVIMIDNIQRTPTDLVKGMTVNAVVNSSMSILSLVANSTVTPPNPTPVPTPEPTPVPTVEPVPTPTPVPVTLQEDEGYVVAVTSSPADTVTIKTQRVKLTGEIVTEEKTFTYDPNCIVTRGNTRIYFNEVRPNDIATFKYSGTVLHGMTLEEKDRTITGTLLEKKFVNASSTAVLVIEDANKVKYELRVTPTTKFTRGTLYNMNWNELRVGDSIQAQCEYDRLLTVYATGNMSTVSGKLTSISISASAQEITLQKADGTSGVYQVSTGTYDIYSLRIGMEMTLYLDSWEVYNIVLSNTANTSTAPTSIVGTVSALRSDNTIELVEHLSAANVRNYTVRINESTLNQATNTKLDINQLQVGMNLYIIFTDSTSYTAKSVRILS
jgi:hypothetical protein